MQQLIYKGLIAENDDALFIGEILHFSSKHRFGHLYKTHFIIMDNIQETPTLGEQRVRITFNPSNESVVDRIRQKSAELIDLLQAVRNDEVSKTYDKTPEQLQAQSGEKLRLISLAQTGYEEAAMWAVKAATC